MKRNKFISVLALNFIVAGSLFVSVAEARNHQKEASVSSESLQSVSFDERSTSHNDAPEKCYDDNHDTYCVNVMVDFYRECLGGDSEPGESVGPKIGSDCSAKSLTKYESCLGF